MCTCSLQCELYNLSHPTRGSLQPLTVHEHYYCQPNITVRYQLMLLASSSQKMYIYTPSEQVLIKGCYNFGILLDKAFANCLYVCQLYCSGITSNMWNFTLPHLCVEKIKQLDIQIIPSNKSGMTEGISEKQSWTERIMVLQIVL
jgi:hypothetical protein